MEVIAVYSESPIKTYGLHEFSNLALIRVEYNPEQTGTSDSLFMKLSAADVNYQMVVIQNLAPSRVALQFVVNYDQADQIVKLLADYCKDMNAPTPQVHGPLELIHFSGPHYGDRYGVAAAAFSAVEEAGLTVTMTGFCASSVYLVLPPGSTAKLRPYWKKKFEVPSKP